MQEIWILPGKVEKLMERTNLVLLILLFIACNISYILLPDAIPVRLNAAGYVDQYISKSYFFLLPAIGIFLYMIISLIGRSPERGMNVTIAHAEHHHRISARTLIRIKLVILVACTLELCETIRLSYKELNKPGWPATLWEAILLLVPLLYYISRRRKMRAGGRR